MNHLFVGTIGCLLLSFTGQINAQQQTTLSNLLSNAKKQGLNIAYSSTLTDNISISDSLQIQGLNIETLQSFLETIGFNLKKINDTHVVIPAPEKKIEHPTQAPIPHKSTKKLDPPKTYIELIRIMPEQPLYGQCIELEIQPISDISLFQYRYNPVVSDKKEQKTQQNTIALNLLKASMGIFTVSYERTIAHHWSFSSVLSSRFWAAKNQKFNYLELSTSFRYFIQSHIKGPFIQASISSSSFDIEGFNNSSLFFSNLPSQQHKGWFVGTTLSFGYRMPLKKNIFLEPVIGYGLKHIQYIFPNISTQNKPGMHELAINIGYTF
ncbi:MAG: DUF3575 domain-containing protein [Bacteroidales bacterium]